jgi:hypothetical protein
MREKLNSNPLAQVGLIGVLLVLAGFFAMTTMGGGGEDSGATTTTASTPVETPAGTASVTATLITPTGTPAAPAASPGALPIAPRPLPRAVTTAWAANETVVLLFVRDGGIDDRLVKASVERLESLANAAVFVVPAGHIARYAAIAQGVDVNRVPALVVIRPKRLGKGVPTASVHYGFQSPQSIVQAVVDAGYKGRTVPYHP